MPTQAGTIDDNVALAARLSAQLALPDGWSVEVANCTDRFVGFVVPRIEVNADVTVRTPAGSHQFAATVPDRWVRLRPLVPVPAKPGPWGWFLRATMIRPSHPNVCSIDALRRYMSKVNHST